MSKEKLSDLVSDLERPLERIRIHAVSISRIVTTVADDNDQDGLNAIMFTASDIVDRCEEIEKIYRGLFHIARTSAA